MINFDDIPLIETKYNFFKNTFFPSAIIEWNKLHPTILITECFFILKSNNLKFITLTTKFLNRYKHREIRQMTRLCLGQRRLREQKFSQNFQIYVNSPCN